MTFWQFATENPGWVTLWLFSPIGRSGLLRGENIALGIAWALRALAILTAESDGGSR